MSSPVLTVTPETSVIDAVKLMTKKGIGDLVVAKEEGLLAGIVTERDIITKIISQEKEYRNMKVAEIMTKNVITVNTDATLLEVSKLMNKHHNPVASLPFPFTQNSSAGCHQLITHTSN
jgi:CBS domain-containing protein